MIDIAFEVPKGRVHLRWLRKVSLAALSGEDIADPVRLGVVIASDDTVRGLNRAYRGRDSTTDVLSFKLWPDHGDDTFVTPPDDVIHLGEVIISYDQAQRQAIEAGRPIEAELATLLVHGVLHLLGYDHEGPEGSLMEAREHKIFEQLSLISRIP